MAHTRIHQSAAAEQVRRLVFSDSNADAKAVRIAVSQSAWTATEQDSAFDWLGDDSHLLALAHVLILWLWLVTMPTENILRTDCNDGRKD